ncbi:MAG: DUF1302 domain-containing protein [Betaproteobacteria bacterium]|nr:DUF1302 domain-containing protein [Betaproteobacteria bacterium]
MLAITKCRDGGGRVRLMAYGLLVLAGILGSGRSEPVMAKEAKDLSDQRVDIFYENATFHRDHTGLSKFRNTLQMEVDKKLGRIGSFDNLNFHARLRGSWDGAFQMNDDKFGDRAGGAITLEDTSGVFPGGAAHGAGIPLFNSGGVGGPTNPNQGLVVLGSHLHPADGGVTFGVPVRPCNVDSRGCIKDYMDASRSELESPEFNDRLDFIREIDVSGLIPLGGGRNLFIKVGKQQVVWGRTDLFRVLDVINPVDFSRHNIYDELQDIRIPMWIAQAEYRMGASDTFDDLNLQFVWNFDKFRPHNLGQGGSPYQILDAASFFRGMKNCWDNGCTVSNFVPGALIGAPNPAGFAPAIFGPNQIGIRQAHLPSWSLGNTQFGVKLEGQKGGVGFSLNALSYRSQLPSLRGGITSVNPFMGTSAVWPHALAFDIHFPRVNLIGGSLDLQADAIKSVFRVEAALTEGEEFPNTLRPELFSKSKVFRYVVGWDRPTFIPFLNKNRAFLISGQLFGQHLLDYEYSDGPLGPRGIPDWENNHILTLLIKGWYQNDRLSPQVIMAHDVRAEATTIAPSVEWLVTDNLKLTLGANVKVGDGARKFDDNRSAMPYTNPFGIPNPSVSQGLGGFEPIGRFRAGPIGMAQKEDEIQLTLRYKF